MATQETQQRLLEAATQARDLLVKARDRKRSSGSSKPKVQGSSVFRPPAARGDDFSGGFEESGGADVVRRTGGSIGGAINVVGGLLAESDLASAAQRSASGFYVAPSGSSPSSGRLSSDALRTSNINTATSAAPSSQGPRSTRRVLSDKEVDEYGQRGIFEGDFVPEEGVLLPDGTFDPTSRQNMIEQLDQARQRLEELRESANQFYQQETENDFAGVSSDEPIIQQEEAAVDAINEPSLIFESSFAMLDQLESSIQSQLDAEIDSAKAGYEADKIALEAEQAREAGSLSTGLARAGGYLGFSGSGTGVMLSLTKSHRAELQTLQVQRDQAIAEARKAAAESRFNVVRDKAKLVSEIEREAYEQQVAYQTEMKKTADKQKEQAQEQQTQQDIFTAIQNGNETVEDIFATLGGTVDVAEISDFLKKTGTAEGGFSFTPTQTARMLGTGMSGDDVKALSEYVSENGYNETVRAAMTPAQRAAADKVFRPLEKAGVKTKTSDPMSLLDLDRIEDSYGVRFPFGVTPEEVTQFFNDNPGATPEELQAALDQTISGGTERTVGSIEFTKEELQNNLTTDQQKEIADLVGASSWWKPKSVDIKNFFESDEFITEFNRRANELAALGFAKDEIIDALTQ